MGLQAKLWYAATLAACILISTNDARVVSRRYGDTETGVSRLQLTRVAQSELQTNIPSQQYQRNPLKTQSMQTLANAEIENKPIVVAEVAQALSSNNNRREEVIRKIYQNIARTAASRQTQVFTNAQFGQEENNGNVNAMSAKTGPSKDVLTGGFSARFFLPQQVSAPRGNQRFVAVRPIVKMTSERQQTINQESASQDVNRRGQNEGQQAAQVMSQEIERQRMQGRMMNERRQKNEQQNLMTVRGQSESEQQLGRQENMKKNVQQRAQMRGRMEINRGAVRMEMVERPRPQTSELQNPEMGMRLENVQQGDQRQQNEADIQSVEVKQQEGMRQQQSRPSGEMQGRREQGERQQFGQRMESQQAQQEQGGRRWSQARQYGRIQPNKNQGIQGESTQSENAQDKTENKQENGNARNQQNEEGRIEVLAEVQVGNQAQGGEGEQQETNERQEGTSQKRKNYGDIKQQNEFREAIQSENSRQLNGDRTQQGENQNNQEDSDGHYQFEYYVVDPHTHDIKRQKESSDGHVVTGHYSLVQPDGMLRTVDYKAHGKTGFEAKVHYSPAPKMEQNQKAISGASFNLGKRN